MATAALETRKCVRCHKEFPVNEGHVLLRGASFACHDCYKKQKEETKDAEVCEFC